MQRETIKVLLVEDDPDDAALITDFFALDSHATFRTRHVPRLSEALSSLKDDIPDVVILDLNLPDSKGLDGLKKVRSAVPHLPVLILTGQEDDALAMKAVSEGAQDYVIKDRGMRSYIARAVRYAIARHRVDLELFHQKNLLQIHLDISGVVKLHLDRDCRVIGINKRGAETFGASEADLLGIDFIDRFVPAERRSETRKAFLAVVEDREPVVPSYENELMTPSGLRTLRWTSAVLRDPQGRITSILSSGEDITEQLRAERLRSEQAAVLKSIIENMSDAVFVADMDGKFILTNKEAFKIVPDLDVPRERWSTDYGTFYLDQTTPFPSDELPLARALRGESVDQVEVFVKNQINPGGIFLSLSARPLMSEDGRQRGGVLLCRDVTVRKRNELALEEARVFIERAQEAAHIGTWIASVSADTPAIWSAETYRIHGIEIGSIMTTRRYNEMVHPQDRDRIVAQYGETLSHGRPYITDFRVIRPDGAERWVHKRASAVLDENGRTVKVVGIVQDITDRKTIEIALRDTQAFLERAQQAARIGSWTASVDWAKPLVWSAETYRIFGVPQGTPMTSDRFLMCVHPDDREAVQKASAEAIATGKRFLIEHRIVLPDGTVKWVDERADVVPGPSGAPERMIGTVQDVTERKEAEHRLRESDENLRQIAENINGVFWMTNARRSEVIYVSPAFSEVWGRPFEDLINDPGVWGESIHPDDRHRLPDLFTSNIPQDGIEQEYRIIRPGGEIRWIRDRAFAIRDKSGRVFRLAGVAEDITRQRELEAELQMAQKMEAVGRLAGGVAHDFNNLLTAIQGYCALLAQQLPPESQLADDVSEIKRAATRAAELTHQLLAFSRKQVLQPRVLDLNEVVRAMEKMIGRLVGEDITMETALQKDAWSIRADQGQVEQVIMNLVVNARDAMPAGGRLSIRTANVASTTPSEANPTGHWVALEIADSGIGMDQKTKERIFEPFFTTKEKGKGTGLGLPMVYGIVSQSGGRIEVQSEPSKGATFRILLPAEMERAEVIERAPVEQARGGTETVLLVEDEDTVRRLAHRVLSTRGYNVLSARDGEEALIICRDHAGPIHLMLTDVVMPKMNGRDLAERVRVTHPTIRVIFMSGYAEGTLPEAILQEKMGAFFEKPFTPDALARKVREVIGAEPGAPPR